MLTDTDWYLLTLADNADDSVMTLMNNDSDLFGPLLIKRLEERLIIYLPSGSFFLEKNGVVCSTIKCLSHSVATKVF